MAIAASSFSTQQALSLALVALLAASAAARPAIEVVDPEEATTMKTTQTTELADAAAAAVEPAAAAEAATATSTTSPTEEPPSPSRSVETVPASPVAERFVDVWDFVDDFFDDRFFSPPWCARAHRCGRRVPAAAPTRRIHFDVTAADDGGYTLVAELPGVPRDGVSISVVDGGVLDVKASSAHSKFVGQVQLPFGVEASKITARQAEGVLNLHVPKPSVATSTVAVL